MWLDAMNRDALAIALPGWEYQEGDVIDVNVTFEEGWDYGYETCVNRPDRFEVTVRVTRPDAWGNQEEAGKCFYGSDAVAKFFSELMIRGSRNESE